MDVEARSASRESARAHAGGRDRPLRICLFGAAGDTGNLGVSALMHSTLAGIARFAPDAEVTVFDNGWGEREASARVGGGRRLGYTSSGVRLSRRYHRPESYAQVRLALRLGGLANRPARAMRAADALWDASGGDSFSDIYGPRQERIALEPKRIALAHGLPLLLLPQTYGPFRSRASRRRAARLVRHATLAWARDERSFSVLRELAGDAFDPERHRCGVDLAFGLPAYEPAVDLPRPLAGWLEPGRTDPLVGVNASGLLFAQSARERFGLAADYRGLLLRLVRELVRSGAHVVLVPHVVHPAGAHESDSAACRELFGRLSRRERVARVPDGLDPCETKWILSRLDWFAGTRMHSCIGALSSGVPAAGLAYSPKTAGVFETVGQRDHVPDLRREDEDACFTRLWRSFEARSSARRSLAEHLPAVRRRAEEQMLDTLAATAALARA